MSLKMESSTQQLLEEVDVAEADDLMEATIRRKKQEEEVSNSQSRIYNIHKKTLDMLFLRLSTIYKQKMLKLLIEHVKDHFVITTIVASLNTVLDKLAYYLKVMPETNYIYDKLIMDHNRSIEPKELKLSIQDNIEWFQSLNTVEQYNVLLSLFKSCGPAILRSIYPTLLAKNYNLVDVVDEQYSSTNIKRDSESFYLGSKETENILQMRKSFDQTLATFRKRVETEKLKIDKLMKPPNKLPPEKEKGKKNKKDDKKKGKKDKSSKSSKSKKSKKKKDSSKSSKKSKKEANKIIDRIQLLPVFISKQIFSYFDDKSLKKLKAVNSYWEYLIQDILKERKTRKLLDKLNKKTLEQLEPEFIEECEQNDKKVKSLSYTEKTNILGKREEKLMIRGAILNKLKPDFKSGPIVETSLFSPLVKHMSLGDPREYLDEELSTADMVMSFPRLFNRDTLYKKQPCQSLTSTDEQFEHLFSVSGTSVVFKVDIAKETEIQDW